MTRSIYPNVLTGVALGLIATGCAGTAQRSHTPGPSTHSVEHFTAAHEAGAGTTPTAYNIAAGAPLSFEQAMSAALQHSPELAASGLGVKAAEARTRQAGAFPNPELEFEIEEYNRDGEGFDSAEMAVGITQPFELGGKRRARRRLAASEGELTGWDYRQQELHTSAETARRFTAVLAAQERLSLAVATVELAQKTSDAVVERVKAGKEPPFQTAKSEAELELARLTEKEARNALRVSRLRLAAMWGAESASFSNAAGQLHDVIVELPSEQTLLAALATAPDLARWEAELRARDAAVDTEKAARIPDLEASIAYLQYQEDDTDAYAFGVGMPLPLFDLNRGNVAAARHELARAKNEQAAIRLSLAAELAEAYGDLTTTHQRVAALRQKIVPSMELSYDAAHEGYREGKFSFLDMLDAQRGLFEAQGSLVDALEQYRNAVVAIETITGAPIEKITQKISEVE